jgi:hypothetical protein
MKPLFDNGDGFMLRIIADYSELDEICCAASDIFDGLSNRFDDDEIAQDIDPHAKIEESGISLECLRWPRVCPEN